MHKLLRQLHAIFRRQKLDAEMTEEMRLHLERRAEENLAAGMSADEARYAAQRSFGGVDQLKEIAREQRSGAWLSEFCCDLKFACRGLAKARTFTAVAAAILALGIGVNTALFSVVHAVFIDPYPYARSDEIWVPRLSALNQGGGVGGLRIGESLALTDLSAIAQAMAANPQQANLGGGINPEVVRTVHMSATAFEFLGVPPLLGRALVAGDVQPNGTPQPVALLSSAFWRAKFDADPRVIGRTLVLDDVPHTVVGVMPPRFQWLTGEGLWLPQATTSRQQGTNPFLRLKPGITPEVAEQQIHAQLLELQKTTPNRFPKDGFSVHLDNFLETTGSGTRSNLGLLMFGVAFLLLIAGTNVASLQLARGASRVREMAVRRALGASRGRLVRQLLTENLVLSILGGGLGVVLAFWLTRLIVLLLPAAYLPGEARVELNPAVLAFCAGLSVVVGVIAGLFPAAQCTRPDLSEALKQSGNAMVAGRRGRRTRSGLVVAQVALSVLLVTGAMLTIRGFVTQRFFDPGFRPERTLMLRVPLTPQHYRTATQRNAFTQELLARIGRLPGVVSVAAGTLPGMEGNSTYAIPGQNVPEGARMTMNAMSTEYLSSLGIPLLAGRMLTEQEIADGQPVAVINAAAAKLWSDGASPLGRIIQVAIPPPVRPGVRAPAPATADGKRNVTVVGMVGDIRDNGLGREASPGLFLPFTLRGGNQRLLIVRTEKEPLTLLHAVRTELRALDPTQPLDQPVTWQDLLTRKTSAPRFNLALFNGLALIALALTGAGIYSALSFSVAERTRELGIRVALGAARRDILGLILGEGLRLLLFGVGLGFAAGLVLAQLVSSQIFVVPLLDPLALGATLIVLGPVALLACYFPARRAARVDPMVALRAD